MASIQPTDKEHGNVLFIILLCVALFAMLSYAVTQSTRSTGNGASKEQSQLTASEMLNQMTLIRSTYERLKLSNGCDDNTISFYKPSNPYYSDTSYFALGSTTPNSLCNLFDVSGGHLEPPRFPEEAGRATGHIAFVNGYMFLRNYIKDIGRNHTNGSDWEASDLSISIQFTNKAVCQQFNKLTDFADSNADPPNASSIPANLLSGSCANRTDRVCSVAYYDTGFLQGKHAGCFYQPNSSSWVSVPRYIAYMVIDPG